MFYVLCSMFYVLNEYDLLLNVLSKLIQNFLNRALQGSGTRAPDPRDVAGFHSKKRSRKTELKQRSYEQCGERVVQR